jgi:hypothetical protein
MEMQMNVAEVLPFTPRSDADDTLSVGRFKFRLANAEIANLNVEFPTFLLMKERKTIEAYRSVITGPITNMIELGVMRGGSAAFFSELYQPKNHLVIDIADNGVSGLKELGEVVAADGRQFRMDLTTSQTDTGKIMRMFGGMAGADALLDLVIDDASHNYELSRVSFEGLFPSLRPGGWYIIEDWGWSCWLGGPWQSPEHPDFKEPALANLVVNCIMAVTGGTNMISEVRVTPDAVFVRRGEGVPALLSRAYGSRGRDRSPF